MIENRDGAVVQGGGRKLTNATSDQKGHKQPQGLGAYRELRARMSTLSVDALAARAASADTSRTVALGTSGTGAS